MAEVDEDRTYRRRGSGFSRDLGAEAHVVAIGIWQRIWGVLYIALGGIFVIMLIAGAVGGSRSGRPELILFSIVGAGLVLGLSALCYQVGVGLMKFAPWSRVAMVVFFVLGCLRVVLTFDLCGGVITIGYGAAQLWALYGERGSRVFLPRYVHEARQDPRPVPWASSPFFWLPFVFIALIVLVFIAVVAVGAMR